MQQRGREWREEDWDQDRSRRWQGGERWQRDPYRESSQREWQGARMGQMGQEPYGAYGGEGYREGYRGAGEGYRGDWREGDGSRGWRSSMSQRAGMQGMQGGMQGVPQGGYGRFGGQLGSPGAGGWQEETQYGPYSGQQPPAGYGYGGHGAYGYGAPSQGFGSSMGMGMEEEYGRGGPDYGRRGGREVPFERRGGGGPWSQREGARGMHGQEASPMGMEGDWGRGMPEWSGGGYGGGSYGYMGGYSGRAGAGIAGRRTAKRGPKNYQRSDERIREDVCDRLMSTDIDCGDIEIRVQQGEVTLTGAAESGEARREIERVAESVSGVKEVTNQIRTKRGSEEEESSRGMRAQQTASQGSSPGQTSAGSSSTGQAGRQTSSSQSKT